VGKFELSFVMDKEAELFIPSQFVSVNVKDTSPRGIKADGSDRYNCDLALAISIAVVRFAR
jgi:hypothetical protein